MHRASVVLSVIVIASIALLVHAASPTTKPSSDKPSGPRLFSPYSKMTSLTDEQKTKIHDIRRKALADIREIERKQTDEITALLSDEQKTELREIEEKTAADAKKAKSPSEEMSAEK